jgi:6-phospho-beta-glucosidase
MRLAILGGGARMPALVDALLRERPGLFSAITVCEPDAVRRQTFGRLAVERSRPAAGPTTVRLVADAEEAFEDVDVVFAAIRVGGDRGRVIDEEVAIRRGLVGQETTGAGGAAMALRNIPVMLDYARALERCSPRAVLINFTNPVGIVTQALAERVRLRVVGVCDTPSSTLDALARFLGPAEGPVSYSYAGLNHLGWFCSVMTGGTERVGELVERYGELARFDRCFSPFDPALVGRLGCIPTEYLYYFYDARRYVEAVSAAGLTRGAQVEQLNAELTCRVCRAFELGADEAWAEYTLMLAARQSSYLRLDLGRGPGRPDRTAAGWASQGYEGIAIAVVDGLLGSSPGQVIVNVRNDGALGFLDPDEVVEVPAFVSRSGLAPLAVRQPPALARSLMTQVKEYERGIVQAALTGQAEVAVMSLAVHPLVPGVSAARGLMADYCERHGSSLGYLR